LRLFCSAVLISVFATFTPPPLKQFTANYGFYWRGCFLRKQHLETCTPKPVPNSPSGLRTGSLFSFVVFLGPYLSPPHDLPKNLPYGEDTRPVAPLQKLSSQMSFFQWTVFGVYIPHFEERSHSLSNGRRLMLEVLLLSADGFTSGANRVCFSVQRFD